MVQKNPLFPLAAVLAQVGRPNQLQPAAASSRVPACNINETHPWLKVGLFKLSPSTAAPCCTTNRTQPTLAQLFVRSIFNY